MSTVAKKHYTPEEYLALEETAQHRSEYYQGEIFAMAGGTPRHNDIGLNIVGELRRQLRGRECKAQAFDLRVRINLSRNGLYTYPDVVVHCAGARFDKTTLLDPTLIVELLTPPRDGYRRAEKFEIHKSKVASLQEYVLLDQVAPRIEWYLRQGDDSWNLTEVNGLDGVIEFPSIGCKLRLADAYEGVAFGDEPSSRAS